MPVWELTNLADRIGGTSSGTEGTSMTHILEQAMTKAAKLSEAAQDQLGEQLLEDIESELKWDETLAASQPLLEQMAAKARRDKAEGKTTPGGFDRL
jgi:mevalonate kinase